MEFLDDAAQSDQAEVGWDVGHEVDIAVGSVLAASDATEDVDVRDAMFCRDGDDVAAVSANSPTERPAEPFQAASPGPHPYVQIEAGRVDQGGQRGQRRLTMSGLVGADHALRYART